MDAIENISNNVKAIKSGIWYTVATFITKGIGFITTPIFVRMLSKTDYGLFYNYMSCLSILMVLVSLNLESTMICARYDYNKEFDSYVLSMITMSGISCLVWMIILNVFSPYFVQLMGIEKKYIDIMMVYLLFSPVINLYLAREAYCFEYKKSIAVSLLVSVGSTILSIIFVSFFDDKLEGRILGSSFPTIIIGAIIGGMMILYGKRIRIEYWRYALPICLPFIPHLLSLMVLGSIDRIMITKICGPEYNAVYSLAYTCSTIITMIVVAFNNAYAPWLGNKLHIKAYDEINKVSKGYIGIFMFISIGVILFSPEIVLIWGGNSYSDGTMLIPPIASGCMLQFLYGLFVNVEQFERKTIWMALASISAAVVNYLLNAVCIPRYGYSVAAYTTFIGYLWLLIIHMIIVWKYGYKNVYSYRFVFIMILICSVIMMFAGRVFAQMTLRYTLIGIYISFICVGIVIYRRKLLVFLKTILAGKY